MPPRGAHNVFSGPRLPRSIRTLPECFRCSDTRRKLHDYGLVAQGKPIGSIKLCDPCSEAITPLNADPLQVA